MSTCGNCDCANKNQCVKKGNSYGIITVDTEKSYVEEAFEISATGENDGNCNCATSCTCSGCNCGK
ncbi:hypothetical protein IEQ34_002632 [Dendrobium chrysotoxum]|uniref:Uncharacterized protein n=1 Tax=Dendrobium chrysotoxum TaxID=161865 RepID=A0AAV7HID5_DENCH|nr:hypothetical protein IEQ34_002632 [Dendrobium chrysotoxum]